MCIYIFMQMYIAFMYVYIVEPLLPPTAAATAPPFPRVATVHLVGPLSSFHESQ